MKKTIIAVILICILLLIGIDVKIMLSINSIESKLNVQTDLLQSQITDLQKQNNKIEEGEVY